MEPIVDEVGEVAQAAISEVGRADSNWAAVILLIVFFGLVAVAMLVTYLLMQERVKLANRRLEKEEQRTNEEKATAEERLLLMRQAHEREIHYRDNLNARYDDTLNKVNATLGGVSEAWRQGNQIHERSNQIHERSNAVHEGTQRALQHSLELLERFAPPPPTLPKRSSRRKPQVIE